MSTARDSVEGHRHGRVPRDVRERQVLGVATTLFAERGYPQASMDELASRAGVSKPVVYDLVGSKERLYRRCVEDAGRDLAERITAAVVGVEEPEARLRAGATAFFGYVGEAGGGWELLVAPGPSIKDEQLQGIRSSQAALLASLLSETSAHDGIVLAEWQTAAIAHALNGAFESLAFWWRSQREVPAAWVVEGIVALVMPSLEALRRASAPPEA